MKLLKSSNLIWGAYLAGLLSVLGSIVSNMDHPAVLLVLGTLLMAIAVTLPKMPAFRTAPAAAAVPLLESTPRKRKGGKKAKLVAEPLVESTPATTGSTPETKSRRGGRRKAGESVAVTVAA